MSFDPSKLTPAPWKCSGVAGKTTRYVYSPCGTPVAVSMSVEDAAFIALARQAFDVMMRRGWNVIALKGKTGVLCGWYVETGTKPDVLAEMPDEIFAADDPFTALVEAEAWYVANVEGLK